MKGRDFIDLAQTRLGEDYVYGATVALDDPDWHGPWDCAEFVTWVVKQVTGKIYGVTADNDPWTGAWRRDVLKGTVVPMDIDEAVVTPGAILLCFSYEGHHIVLSVGDGKRCIGAQNYIAGVAYKSVWMLDWSYGIKIPGVEYA